MNFIFCNTFCIQPKFYDTDYDKYSSLIKPEIEIFMRKIEKSNNDGNSEQNLRYIGYLWKMIDVLGSNNQKLRQNLINLRDEFVKFKDSTSMTDDRIKIVDLSIQVVMLCYSATFYCNSASNYDKNLNKIKEEFEHFKVLIKNNRSVFNQYDKFYLSTLYKIPKLMRIKRGFKKKTPLMRDEVTIDAD
jgi:hypothetical protein